MTDKIQADIRAKYKVKVGLKQSKFLRMVINNIEDGILVHNCNSVQKLLFQYAMDNCKPCDTPLIAGFGSLLYTGPLRTDLKSYRKLIGWLMYPRNTARPHIVYDINSLARFLQKPQIDHWTRAKNVLQYLQGTKTLGIYYNKNGNESFEGYADSDWAQERPDRKSVTSLLLFWEGTSYAGKVTN